MDRHTTDLHPLILDTGEFTWRITSMDFGWETQAVHDFLEKTEDGQINEFTRSSDKSRNSTVKLYGESEIGLDARRNIQSTLSFDIHKILKSSINFQAGSHGSIKTGLAASREFNWREQDQKRARELNNVMKKIDKQIRVSKPFLEFTVLFINSGNQNFNCTNLQIPVMVGQQVVAYAMCYESQSSSNFDIPASRPLGVPVRFRASLDNSNAMRLLEGMQDKPLSVRIENSRGQIVAEETGEDIISKMQKIAGISCAISILVPYAPPLTWKVAKTSAQGNTNLQNAMEAINAIIKEGFETNKPLFVINDGILDSVAGVDNAMGGFSSATQLWWKISVNGHDQPFDLMRHLDGEIVFSLNKGIPDFSVNYVDLIHASAKNEDTFHQYMLARCFADGNGVTKDEVAAFNWYRKAAEQGHDDAQNSLGVCYAKGVGVAKNEQEAVKWYCKAAEQGYADAQNSLGVCYAKGVGVAKDEQEAVKWYCMAAEQGHADAQNSLGVCYAKGVGVAKNEQEAVKWYCKAAEQGHVDAQNNLGRCYNYGRGIAKDEQEAVKWYRKAAEQGHAAAQHNLGRCYQQGVGVAKDAQEAVKWYRKAAEQGYAAAQFELGACYAKGVGVAKDEQEAAKWYIKAAIQRVSPVALLL